MTQQNKPTPRIETNVKFRHDKERDRFIAYVTKNERGSWRGCRPDAPCKMKIVIADYLVQKTLIENYLYHAILIPMKNDLGFIAIKADVVQFPAQVITIPSEDSYKIEVKFGNWTITYDPYDQQHPSRCNLLNVIDVLANRSDIKDVNRVIADLKEAAFATKVHYERKKSA